MRMNAPVPATEIRRKPARMRISLEQGRDHRALPRIDRFRFQDEELSRGTCWKEIQYITNLAQDASVAASLER